MKIDMTQSSRIPGAHYARHSVRSPKGAPEVVRRTLKIKPAEAATVRMIYDLYTAGVHPLELNRRPMPLHRGAHDDR